MISTLLTRIVLMAFLLLIPVQEKAADTPKDFLATATVGVPVTVSDVILPGSELVAKPIENDPPMIVQVLDSIQHGDSFRYQFRFSGLEPGTYDLGDWLIRKDGTETGELGSVPIEIHSLLPPEQVTPHSLSEGQVPRFGGYKILMILGATIWGIVMLMLLFGGKKKKANAIDDSAAPKDASLADLLKDRIQLALNDDAETHHYAELERMLFSFWRKKLGYDSLPPEKALSKIKSNDDAGPLMIQLEQWIHRPDSSRVEVDLAELLEPYRDLHVDSLESTS